MGAATIYRRLQRQLYLLKKYIASFGKPTVIYTKPHPIFTSVFESAEFSKYNPVFIRLSKPKLGMLEKVLLNKAALVHADSANFPRTALNKPLVVECEGKPYDKYFESTSVNKILVESRIAGRDFWGNEKMQLCYPTIKVHGQRRVNTSRHLTLLCVGYGGYIKGYDVVYKLYKTLSSQHDIRLIIAGALGHDYESYKEVTREAYEREGFDKIEVALRDDPKVTLRPYKRRQLLDEIYPQADIFIQLSRMETFGYSILEAMSFGLPVVSCDFTAIREIVEHEGNGFLVHSNNYDIDINDYRVDINSEEWGSNCYAEALTYVKALIEQPALREKMGKRSLEIIREKFHLDNRVGLLDDLYSSLIGK